MPGMHKQLSHLIVNSFMAEVNISLHGCEIYLQYLFLPINPIYKSAESSSKASKYIPINYWVCSIHLPFYLRMNSFHSLLNLYFFKVKHIIATVRWFVGMTEVFMQVDFIARVIFRWHSQQYENTTSMDSQNKENERWVLYCLSYI